MLQPKQDTIRPNPFLAIDVPRPEQRATLNESEVEIWCKEDHGKEQFRREFIQETREHYIPQEKFESQLVSTVSDLKSLLNKPYVLMFDLSYGSSHRWTAKLAEPLLPYLPVAALFVSDEESSERFPSLKSQLPEDFVYLFLDDGLYNGCQVCNDMRILEDIHAEFSLQPPQFIVAAPFIGLGAEEQLLAKSNCQLVSNYQRIHHSELLLSDPRGILEVHTTFFDHKVSDTHFLRHKDFRYINGEERSFFNGDFHPYKKFDSPYSLLEQLAFGEYLGEAFSVDQLQNLRWLDRVRKDFEHYFRELGQERVEQTVRHVIDVKKGNKAPVGLFP